jgi:hypothetical protein
MDQAKIHDSSKKLLEPVLLLLTLLLFASLESLFREKYLVVLLVLPVLLMLPFLRRYGNEHDVSIEWAQISLLLYVCGVPFFYFYQQFPSSWYYFSMVLASGFFLSFFLGALCRIFSDIAHALSDEVLGNEASTVSRLLYRMPFGVFALVWIILAKNGMGLKSLISCGRWLLIGWFPIVLAIASVLPLMLACRLLLLIKKSKVTND